MVVKKMRKNSNGKSGILAVGKICTHFFYKKQINATSGAVTKNQKNEWLKRKTSNEYMNGISFYLRTIETVGKNRSFIVLSPAW